MEKTNTRKTWVINLNDRERRTKFYLFVFYIISLVLSYILVLSPMYTYSHLRYEPNYQKLIISLISILICFALLPKNPSRPSTYLYFILLSIVFIPTAMYYWLNNQPTLYFLYETFCFVMISMIIKSRFHLMKIKAERAQVFIHILFVFYFLSCVYLIFHNGGIHLSAIVTDLYQLRSENNIAGLSGYILNWCAKSFMPLFFAYFYMKRKWVGVVVTIVLQALLFASYGFKAFLMAVFMLIGVSYLMKNPDTFKNKWILTLTIGNAISIVIATFFSKIVINIFTYRTLFLPAQGQFEYYDFFTHNRYLYFSEGSIGRIFGIEYPYSETIGRVVNSYIFGALKNSNGNTGAFSYGFADLGFAGMILAAIVIALVLLIVDSSSSDLPVILPVGAMAYHMFALNDNNVLICLNTGGIIWTIFMLVLLNSVYSNIVSNREDTTIFSNSE